MLVRRLSSGLHLSVLAGLAHFSPSRSAHAEEPSTPAGKPAAEPPVEVIVSGELGDRSRPTTVLDSKDLALEASGRLEGAVGDLPGVTQFRRSDARSAHPTSQGLTLRGLGGNAASRVLVLYDGVPQADPFGGWISWPSYDALPIASVRLERGGGSGEHGFGALGGTLDIRTADPGASLALGGSGFLGSRESFAGRLNANLPASAVRTALGGAYETSQGFVPIAPEQRGPVDQAAPYEQFSAAARSIVTLSETLSVEVAGRGFQDNRSRGVPFTDNQSGGLDLSLRVANKGTRGADWSVLGYVQGRKLRSSFASVAEDRSSAAQVLDQYHVPSAGAGARFEVRPKLGANVNARWGADFRSVWGRTEERYLFSAGSPTRERQAGGQNDAWGAFAAFDFRLARALVLSASGRADVFLMHDGFIRQGPIGSEPDTNTSFESRLGAEPTGRVGVGYELTRGLNLRSAAYSGFRLPTLNELYRPYRVGADAIAANAALEPERLYGTEVGLDWTGAHGVTASATGFQNQLVGAIANVTLAEGPGDYPGVGFVSESGTYSQRQNLDRLRSLGLELALGLDAQKLFGLPGRVEFSYSHVNARVQGDDVAPDAHPAQVPADTFLGRLVCSPLPGRVQLGATVRNVGNQFEDDRGELILGDATVLDLMLMGSITPELSAVLRAENVTNTPIRVARDGSGVVELATPRTLWLGLSWRGSRAP